MVVVVCEEEVDESVAVRCMVRVGRSPVNVNMYVGEVVLILNVGEVVRVRDGVI